MALDVWIGDWNDRGSRLLVSFEPDELYMFRELIDEAEALAEKKPQQFSVHVGTQLQPRKKEFFVEVEKSGFMSFLESLRDAASQCEKAGKTLHLYGD